MALENFLPEVWSSAIMAEFRRASVLTGLVNRQYEGELVRGSSIHIPGIVDIEVKDYARGMVPDRTGAIQPRTTAPDPIADTGIDLKIDQEKSIDFYVDDIDQVQANLRAGGAFDAYVQSAMVGILDDAELFLTDKLVNEGTPLESVTQAENYDDAHKVVLKLRTELSRNRVPQTSRTLLVNPAFEELLLGNDSKITSFDKTNATDGLREATIGRLLGFDVVSTSWMGEDETPVAVGFWNDALAFVSQIRETEAMRAVDKFADRIRSLHVYGAGVLRPTAVQVFKGGQASVPSERSATKSTTK